MFNLFNSKPKILKYDGLYIGSKKLINKLTQEENRYVAVFKFNENGLCIYTELIEENDENKISLDKLSEIKNEFSEIDNYEPAEFITKYEIFENNKIRLKFFDTNYLNDDVDENNYHVWFGVILNNKLCLSRNETFYSYKSNRVEIETRFNDIEFIFLNLK